MCLCFLYLCLQYIICHNPWFSSHSSSTVFELMQRNMELKYLFLLGAWYFAAHRTKCFNGLFEDVCESNRIYYEQFFVGFLCIRCVLLFCVGCTQYGGSLWFNQIFKLNDTTAHWQIEARMQMPRIQNVVEQSVILSFFLSGWTSH